MIRVNIMYYIDVIQYWSLDYLTMLFHLQRLYSVEWGGIIVIKDERVRIWKEIITVFSMHYPDILKRQSSQCSVC